MWREEGHGTNSASFHMETQQEVKFLSINQALLEQNLGGRNQEQSVMIYVVLISFKSFPQQLQENSDKKGLYNLIQAE